MAQQPDTAGQAAEEDLEEGEIADEVDDHFAAAAALPSQPGEPLQSAAAPASGGATGARLDKLTPAQRNRKQKKEAKKAAKQAAAAAEPAGRSWYSQFYGEQARASVQIKEQQIRLRDVQALLLWLLADGANPRWAFVKNKPLVQKVVLVAVPGIDAHTYESRPDLLPNMRQALGQPARVTANNATMTPGKAVAALFTVPEQRKRKREAEAEAEGGVRRRRSGQPPFPPQHYALTLEQMEANSYPVPVLAEDGRLVCPPGFVATQPASSGEGGCPGRPAHEMVAVDCEMCTTAEGLELTRVTLIAQNGKVLMDELVVPDNPIVDYNTRYSGITAAMLAPVRTRLADVQARLVGLVRAETLLVGHGLENDLAALKLLHANCIDTALLFPHPRGPPYKSALRVLASKFLRRTIQAGAHDSVVDARAALDLALLKVRHGPGYGLGPPQDGGERLLDLLGAAGRRCCMVDRQDTLNRHVTGSASAVVARTDEDAADKARKEAAKPELDFLWTQLRALGHWLEERAQARRATYALPPAPPPGNRVWRRSDQNGGAAAASTPAVNGHARPTAEQDQAAGEGESASSDQGSATSSEAESDRDEQEAGESSEQQAGRVAQAQAVLRSAVPGECAAAAVSTAKRKAQAAAGSKAAQAIDEVASPPAAKRRAMQAGSPASQATAAQPGQQPAPSQPAAVPAQTASAQGQAAATSSPVAAANGARAAGSPLAPPPGAPGASGEPASGAAAAGGILGGAGETAAEAEEREDLTRQADAMVAGLWAGLAPNTLLMVVTLVGDTPEVRRLQEQKFRRQQGLDGQPPWSPACEEVLALAAARAVQALCFCAVKQ